jgi:histidinol-phosphatase (PHP family)
LAGIELGCSFADPEYCKELTETGGYDLVINSVHALRYKDQAGSHRFFNIGDMTEEAVHECMSNYFEDVMRAMQEVGGDVVAHLTCPLRYINGVYKKNLKLEPHEQEIRKILQYMISHDIALEVNSSNRGGYGGSEGYSELMPNEWILHMYRDMGGELLTFGSDAHVTEKIYHYGEETAELLKKCGFRHLYYYKQRKAIAYDIL